MEIAFKLILILAAIDFTLTAFWLYRWQNSRFLRKFKRRVKTDLLEANPIINHGIKHFGVYPGLFMGYCFTLLIQFGLAKIHNVIAWGVVGILVWHILIHIKNNITTRNGYILKMTAAHNKIIG